MTHEEDKAIAMSLLVAAHNGNRYAENDLLEHIRLHIMPRRIGRLMSKNRQVSNEDLRQEYLIGVALKIHKAKLDVGDPIEYILAYGLWRAKQYMARRIKGGTFQFCEDCGKKSRLNKVGYSTYQCVHCGSLNITTHETEYKDDVAMNMVADTTIRDNDERLIYKEIIDEFERTLTPGTNIHKVWTILREGIRDDIDVRNYIAEIARRMGGVSYTCVVHQMRHIRRRLGDFIKQYEEGCMWRQ